MRKTLIILSVLLMFITLTYTLFSFETFADGTITDLTGTKWKMNDTITGTLSSTKYVTGIAKCPIYTFNFNNIHQIDSGSYGGYYIDNTDSSVELYRYAYDTERWYFFKAVYGWLSTSAPTIEITGGADVTDNEFIEWLNDNATQIYDGYDVTFNSNGGSSIDTIENVTGVFLTDEDGYYLPEYIPVRTGYEFDGWYTDTSYTNKITELFILTSDTTLYAKWEQLYYDVTFNSMGGSSVDTIINVSGIFLTDEDGYYLPQYIPTRTGYKFDGWYSDTQDPETLITEIFILTSDITLYAKWVPIFIYFNMNGGKGVGIEDGSDIGLYIYYGGTLELTDGEGNYTTEFTPYKEGWLFQGWYEDSEFTNLVTQVNINDDIILYAKWTKEMLIELNLKTVPRYTLHLVSIDTESVTYISGNSSVVRYIIDDTEEISNITFYAVTAGAVEINFNDNAGDEYSIVIYVSEYGTTINYYKTIYIGEKYGITSGLANVDLSSMTYVGGDDTYCYVSSPYAGIPLNDDEIPEGDYIYFYGLKKGYCIINFNGKEDYPPVTFYLTILGAGEISLNASEDEMNLYIPPIAEQRGWDNLQKQLEDGFYENFINLDAFEIPGELNGFITNFNEWVNPLYTNGFVVAALTLVGIIAFAAYLVTAKTRG